MTFFKNILVGTAALTSLVGLSTFALADGAQGHGTQTHGTANAAGHAPLGVMGDHMHEAGGWMLSVRAMHMAMDGNLMGSDEVSDAEITAQPNRFFGVPGQPAGLRVVPQEMTMDMLMVGGMYAPTDWLTLMVMGMYVEREMSLTTYAAMNPSVVVGNFTSKSKGWGDTKVAGLIRLYEENGHHIHVNLGVSLPTGSIEEKDEVLTPMGMVMETRLPYSMQLGSGTYDLEPGITYTGHAGKLGWGSQVKATIRLGENDQDWALGDKWELTGWGSYALADWVSASLRVKAEFEGKIDGIDGSIVLPVQTADPDNYGGERVELGAGLNFQVPDGALAGHRFGAEAIVPVYEDRNGIQMQRDWSVMVGWQNAF
ncbi:MAG: hypothetical protein ACJAXQ_000412 [Parvibaculaceae bacterium]|jgi:hypothetical protein